MQIKIGELKARARRGGTKLTWDDIEAATGIRRATLISMDGGNAKQIRPEHIDALCAFFGVAVGELLERDNVALPLQMSVRPDKRKVVA